MSLANNDEWPDFSNDPCLQHVWTSTTLCGECPKCNKRNYVRLGDLNDQTAPDVEVVVCWNCKSKLWLTSDMRSEAPAHGYDSIDEGFVEAGRERP